MRPINPEKILNSNFKIVFIVIYTASILYFALNGNYNSIFKLPPWFSFIAKTNFTLSFLGLLSLKIILVVISTYLAWQISISYFNLSQKDYLIFLILPMIHFSIQDWGIGLIIAIYWTFSLFIIKNLFSHNYIEPSNKKILNTAFLGGVLLLFNTLSALFFVSGLLVMLLWRYISIRRIIVWSIGYITPLLLLVLWCYLSNNLNSILDNLNFVFLKENYLSFNFNCYLFIMSAALSLCILLVFSLYMDKKILVRQSYFSLTLQLIILSPAIFISSLNNQILLYLYGFSMIFFLIKAIYNTTNRIMFALLMLIPLIFPTIFYLSTLA